MDTEKLIAQQFWLVVQVTVLFVLSFAIMIWGMLSARKALWAAIEGKLPPITKQDEQLLERATADESLHQRLIEEFGKKQKWLGAFLALFCAMMCACIFAGLCGVLDRVQASIIRPVLMLASAIGILCVVIPMKRINRQWLLLKDLRKKLDRW
jgi:hypothetical protein